MKQYNARIASLREGQSESDVRAIMGEPAAVLSRGETRTPGDAFAELGSSFLLDPAQLEFVWSYADPYRPSLKYRIGFRDGRVVSVWKERTTTSSTSSG